MSQANGERQPVILRTERLVLRGWKDSDAEPFAALNADPEVMEHFPSTHGPGRSSELMDGAQRQIDRAGYGFWAVEITASGRFAGFVGISDVTDAALPFAPAVEIGWRLAREFWGQSIAFEAAQACLDFAFDRLGLEQVVAYTTRENVRSRALMKRLGMRRDPAEDFIHPLLAPGHRQGLHVLYRIEGSEWHERGGSLG